MLAVALAVDVEIEVVGPTRPVDGDCYCAGVGCPEVGGEADGEEEVVAEDVQAVNASRTRRGIRVGRGCVGRSSPGNRLTGMR